MPKFNETLFANLRYQMPPQFKTAEFKEVAASEGVNSDEAQEMLSHMIDRGFIRRVKRGFYQKTERYRGEQ